MIYKKTPGCIHIKKNVEGDVKVPSEPATCNKPVYAFETSAYLELLQVAKISVTVCISFIL
jgi:hypothetical protein